MTPKKGWRERFLSALAATGNVSDACRTAGVSRPAAYKCKDTNQAFSAAWGEALEEATDALEQEARRRAIDGTEKPVFYQGEECGRVREYSDTLLIFLLKGNRPGKFRDRASIEHTGPGGGPLIIREVTIEMPAVDDEEVTDDPTEDPLES